MAKHSAAHWVKWLVVLVVLGAGVGFGINYMNHRGDPAPEYRTAPVALGELIQVVTATGQLNPMTNVQVGSQVSGIINKLYADWNSQVKAGQVVAQLDPATFQAVVHQAEGDLASANAALELSRLNEKRAEELRKNDLIPQADLDSALADLHQAEANVKIRKAALENAQVNLDRTTIYSPIDGIVISRNVDVGQTVAASLSAPTLFLIANDLTRMQIDASVSEADVGGVAVGQPVDFTVDAFPYRTFSGKVIQIRNAPITNQNVVTYDTVIAVSNEDKKLKPGMTANVSIVIAQRSEAMKIPNAALRFRPLELTEGRGSGTNATLAQTDSGRGEGMRGPRRDGEGGRGMGGGRGGEGRRFGGGGDRGGGGRTRGEPSIVRTVYVLPNTNLVEGATSAKLTPVSIKIGISDGIYTEVTSGLKVGEVVVLGLNTTMTGSFQGPGGRPNPFGGGGFRRF